MSDTKAAVLGLSAHPLAQPSLAYVEKTQDTGNAVTVLAPTLARAVSALRTRHGARERAPGFPRSGRGAEAPGTARDQQELTLPAALDPAAATASWRATARRGRDPLRPALRLDLRSRSWLRRREAPTVAGVVPDAGHMAVRTRLHMAAQRCGPARHDGTRRFPDMRGQRVYLLIGWKRGLEDGLERHESHRCLRTRLVLS